MSGLLYDAFVILIKGGRHNGSQTRFKTSIRSDCQSDRR